MHVLIVYGTTEGHTRDLCHFAASALHEAGHPTAVEPAGSNPAQPDPGAYDVVFLAGSLHVGRYQPALTAYARTHHATLNAKRAAFISVSLSAAGHDPDDWEGVEQCLARFKHETLWEPKAVCQAAGAILFSRYDYFKRLALKFIAAQHGQHTRTSEDYDLTDYEALRRFVLEFAGEAARG